MQGFSSGLNIFVYRLFIFEHFGSNHFSIKLAALLNVFYFISVLLLEVPTGALGDYLGRKKGIILSFFFSSIGLFIRTLVYFSPEFYFSIFLAFVAELVLAIGYSFFSGTFLAWLVDSMRTNNIQGGHGPLMAKGTSYLHIGTIIGSTISLTLYLKGHVYIAFCLGVVSNMLVAVYLGATMQETEKMKFYQGGLPIKDSYYRMREIMQIGFSACIKIPPLLYLTVLNALAQTSVFAVLYFWGIVMKSSFNLKEMSLYWYVVVFGGFVSSFMGARLVNQLHSKNFKNILKKTTEGAQWNWVVAVCIFLSLVMTGLGLIKMQGAMSLGVFILGVIMVNFTYGFLWPAMNSLFNVSARGSAFYTRGKGTAREAENEA